MFFRTCKAVIALAFWAASFAAAGQTSDATEDENKTLETVKVTASRQTRPSLSTIEAETRLTSEDIKRYGAGTIEDLLTELGPEIASGRGRTGGAPIVLVDGVRIASFREVSGYPSEAILRLDVLPEEVALKYGYRADQRVINIVLKDEYAASTADLKYGASTKGSGSKTDLDVGKLAVQNSRRIGFNLYLDDESGVLDTERNIAIARGATSLRPDTKSFKVVSSYHRPFDNGVRITMSGDYGESQSHRLLGLSQSSFTLPANSPFSGSSTTTEFSRLVGAPNELQSQSETSDLNLSFTATREIGNWFVSSITKIGHSSTTSLRDAIPDLSLFQQALHDLDPAASPDAVLTPYLVRQFEETERQNSEASTNLLANGRILELPAGDLSAGISLDLSRVDRVSRTRSSGLSNRAEVARSIAKLQGSFDFPVIDRAMEISGVRALSANLTASSSYLSDFGKLVSFDGAVSWKPVEPVRILSSYTLEDGAPSMTDLGDTVTVTPNIPIFDFVTGDSVVVDRIEGGNSQLLADSRRVFKLSSEIKPFDEQDLRLSLTYLDEVIEDPIGRFSDADEELQTAFPNRFTRDATGVLTSYDARPVNYSKEARRSFEWKLTWQKKFSSFSERSRKRPSEAREGNSSKEVRPSVGSVADSVQTLAAPVSREKVEALKSRYIEIRTETDKISFEAAQTEFEQLASTPDGRMKISQIAQRNQDAGLKSAERAQGQPRPSPGRQGGRRDRSDNGTSSRIFFLIRHEMNLRDERTIFDNGSVQDFLDGSSRGSYGGSPDHEVSLYSVWNYHDFGTRLYARWHSPTEVTSSTGSLYFSDVLTTNLSFFYTINSEDDVGQKLAWLRDSRITLDIENLFGETVSVSDPTGNTPSRYETDRIDPLGRYIRVALRKQF